MSEIRINASDMARIAPTLRVGQRVLLSGAVYTARDAAHKRIDEALNTGAPLPFTLRGASIYYAGPTPTPPGMCIGSCGPTTASRMDLYSPRLLSLGLSCMIGKGKRSEAVTAAIGQYGAVYLCALGGAGALAAKCIEKAALIAYEDLGCESVKCLQFRDFPLLVAIDSVGGTIVL